MAFSASWTQKQVADRLVELRGKRTIVAVAEATGIGRIKLQRIERAEVKVDPRDVTLLCQHYGVAPTEIARLCEMAIASRTDAWWERFDRFLAAEYGRFIGFENEARRIDTVQPVLIPGLLQTEGYARGLYAGSVMVPDPDQVDALVRIRMLRQRRLTEPEPLELRAVIGEAALRKPYGGRSVFHTQLKYLRELSELPNVSVCVVPLGAEVVFWPLEFLEFSSGGPAVLYTETLFGYIMHDGETETVQARRVINRITQDALSEKDSAAFIEKLIRESA